MDKRHYHSNEPIGSSKEDMFNFKPFANKVQQAIRNTSFGDEPLIIGVYGKWGEGKSSFLNLIFKDLEIEKEKHKPIIKFRFNPWRYSTEDILLTEFFKGLIKVINSSYGDSNEKTRIVKALEKYIKAILAGTKVEVETGFSLGLKVKTKTTYNFKETIERLESENEDLETQKDSIDELLVDCNKRIVVFLDDIDRLNKEELFLIFRLLKLIASFKNLTYVVALDDEMVSKAIYRNYGDNVNDGKLYLEKIINIPITLPRVDPIDILKELKKGLEDIFLLNNINVEANEDWLKEGNHSYNTGTRRFFSEIRGVEDHIQTPRMLYRLLNSFRVSLIALKDEVNYADLLWLEILKINYFKVYNFIKNDSPFSIGSENLMEAFFTEKSSRRESFKSAVEDFINTDSEQEINKNKVIGLIDKLFPTSKEGTVVAYSIKSDVAYTVKMDPEKRYIERRINDFSFYPIYFNFHTVNKISYLKLNELLKSIFNTSETLEQDFKSFISDNDIEKVKYELLKQLFQVEKTDDKYALISFLIKKIEIFGDVESEEGETLKITSKAEMIKEIFESVSSDEEKEIENLLSEFLSNIDVVNIVTVIDILKSKQVGNEVIDKLMVKLIELVKRESGPFFITYQSTIVRDILFFWKRYHSDTLSEYLKSNISELTVFQFLKNFVVNKFEEFGYKFLEDFVDPVFVVSVINTFYSTRIEEKGDLLTGDNLWKVDDDNDELIELKILAQFLYIFNSKNG